MSTNHLDVLGVLKNLAVTIGVHEDVDVVVFASMPASPSDRPLSFANRFTLEGAGYST